jgi:acyl-ACP thioesterase
VLDPSLPIPTVGRSYRGRRNVRLADMDAIGRVRLDAVARFLQDIAIDDVQETGWGTPEHLWFIRRIRLEVRAPFLGDRVSLRGAVAWPRSRRAGAGR